MPKNKKINVGIIGAGGISQVAHIPNLVGHEDVDLKAICDLNPGKAALVSERLGVKSWYDEPDVMFEKENLDAVVITTPTISHLPLCKIAFEQNVDVLVEKPFARNATEGKKIVDLAEKSGRILMVAMNHRYRDDTIQLKHLLDEGELGEVISLRVGWFKRIGVWGRPYWFTDSRLSGGGVLMDLGLQMIDLTLFLLDSPEIISIDGSASHVLLELDVEDQATGFMKFSNNVTCSLEVSWAACNKEDKAFFHIDTSHGKASLNPLRMTKRQGNRVVEVAPFGLEDEVTLYRNSFVAEMHHFIECVRTREQPVSTGKHAIAALNVVDKIYEEAGY